MTKPPIPADMALQDRLHDYCTRNEITEADEDFFSELLREQSAELERLRGMIEQRRDYFLNKDLHNGWSGKESGPCCERCEMREEFFDGRADALKAVVGCRNPFQIETVCQCHLPVRKAVRNGIVEAHNQLITAFTRNTARTGELERLRDENYSDLLDQMDEAWGRNFQEVGGPEIRAFLESRIVHKPTTRLRARVEELERPDVSAMVGYEAALKEVAACDKCDLCEDHLPAGEQD